MGLLKEVVTVLRRESLPHAIIGAAALSAHGVSRSTADVDLLTTDPRCLTPSPWAPLQGLCEIDIRHGDADDPLLQVIGLGAAETAAIIESRLTALPASAIRLWRKIVAERAS